MTKHEQYQFVRDLCRKVYAELEQDIDKVPEVWDGIELRWWIAERFSQIVFKGTGGVTRKREYNNTVLVENLA